jgi:hypothetical protein
MMMGARTFNHLIQTFLTGVSRLSGFCVLGNSSLSQLNIKLQ